MKVTSPRRVFVTLGPFAPEKSPEIRYARALALTLHYAPPSFRASSRKRGFE
jgi:hypothetical protein